MVVNSRFWQFYQFINFIEKRDRKAEAWTTYMYVKCVKVRFFDVQDMIAVAKCIKNAQIHKIHLWLVGWSNGDPTGKAAAKEWKGQRETGTRINHRF